MFKVMTAMDRLRDSKLGMGVVVKAGKDWRGVGDQGRGSHSARGANAPPTFGPMEAMEPR